MAVPEPQHGGREGRRPSNALRGRRHILSSGVWMAVSTVVPFLATAVLSVVAGRVLGAELLGEQSYIAFVGALASAIAITSLTDASIRHLAALRGGGSPNLAALERWTLQAHLITGVATACAVAALGLTRDEHRTSWLVMAASVVFDALAWAWSSRIVSRDGWAPVARRRLATQVLAVALGVIAVLAGYGITGIFVSNAVATLVLLALLRPIAPPGRSGETVLLRRPVLILWLSFIAGAVLTQVTSGRIEILFLGAYATGSDIAHYTVAVMVVTSAVTLPSALAAGVMPAVAAARGAGDEARADDAVVKALRVSVVLSVPLTALIVATGPELVVALYGDDFREAGQLARYVAVGALLLPAGRLSTAYWSGLGRFRWPLAAGVVGALLELGTAFALIPRAGAVGAVAATLLGQCTTAALTVLLTRRALGRRIVPAAQWAASAAAGLPAAFTGAWVASAGGIFSVLLAGVSTVAVFCAIAAVLSRLGAPVLRLDEAEWVKGALPERAGVLVWPLAGRSVPLAAPRR